MSYEWSYSSTRPPAATIFSRAPALTLSPRTVTADETLPFASTLTKPLFALITPASTSDVARDLRAGERTRERLEIVETHDLRLLTKWIREPALGQAARHRHLTALEVRLAAARAVMARARLDALVPLPDVLPVPDPGPRPRRLRSRVDPGAATRLLQSNLLDNGGALDFERRRFALRAPRPAPPLAVAIYLPSFTGVTSTR